MTSSSVRRRIEFDLDAEDLDRAVQVTNHPDDPGEHMTCTLVDQHASDVIWHLIDRERRVFRRIYTTNSKDITVKNLIQVSSFIILAFLLFGCGSDGGGATIYPSTPVAKSAHLSFSTMNAPQTQARIAAARTMSVSTITDPSQTADYEMGDLDKTSTFLFTLQNTGDIPAAGIQLTSDNPNVVMVPNRIGVLDPVSRGGIQPVIQVTVQHGLSASGTGSAPVLPAGRLAFNISAATTGISASASLGMTVRVTNYTITTQLAANNGAGIQLTYSNSEGQGNLTTSLFGAPACTSWNTMDSSIWGVAPSTLDPAITSPTDNRITNTGNAPITVQRYLVTQLSNWLQVWHQDTDLGDLVVQPGDSVTVVRTTMFAATDISSGVAGVVYGRSVIRIQASTVTAPGAPISDATGAFWAVIDQESRVVPLPSSNG